MTTLGQLALLTALAASGYAAFACLAGAWTDRSGLRRAGRYAGVASVLALSVVLIVLGRALSVKDFSFAYVAEYSSRHLPRGYSLAALWVGQAGSLLVWAWMLGVLSLGVHGRAMLRAGQADQGRANRSERQSVCAFGLMMAYFCFLTATMVFAADPTEANIAPTGDGAGLSPLLQHPAMMIHPPIVFLGFAAWAVPCALTIAALAGGGPDRGWLHEIRPWALFAWLVLGAGILLGAQWSYQELGWGGYWAWDPVENGSLVPWLTGTAFLHTLMTWRARGVLKKTAAALALMTFGLCNFSTFLTRSGIFSSLHAFSRSPIGWLFLGLMIALGVVGGWLIRARRSHLAPERPIASVLSREAMVLLSTVALLLLAAAVIVGTLFLALSEALVGRRVLVGPEFYNHVLVVTGLVLLAAMAPAPLLRWGGPPSAAQGKALGASAGVASLGTGIVFLFGVRHPLGLAVAWAALLAVASLAGGLFLDARRRQPGSGARGLLASLRGARRQYAGFVVHLGFLAIAVGVTGSSLGTQRHEIDLAEGETVRWAGRAIHFARLVRRDEPDKLVVEAELDITADRGGAFTLRPAQHLHKHPKDWTTEAAVHSSWSGDFYTILHNGDGNQAHFTFVVNPLMAWMWFGGAVMGLGVLGALWPERGPARSVSRRELQASEARPVLRSRQPRATLRRRG
jgi:cytochrome c-type biogenesis protein CcmF